MVASTTSTQPDLDTIRLQTQSRQAEPRIVGGLWRVAEGPLHLDLLPDMVLTGACSTTLRALARVTALAAGRPMEYGDEFKVDGLRAAGLPSGSVFWTYGPFTLVIVDRDVDTVALALLDYADRLDLAAEAEAVRAW